MPPIKRRPQRTASVRPASQPPWLPPQRALWAAALIATVAAAAYWPALRGGFVLDDDKLVTENSLVKAPDGLLRMWATTQPTDYWPLTNTSFWIEWRLWGADPTGYHVTNLLLHIAAALLIWAILRKLAIPGAFLAAFLFAVHPVNVESVAWISQRKNTLAMVFFLLSILWYLPTIQPRTTQNKERTSHWYWLSLLAFLLAMLSKGSVAVLPILLLLLVWWQRRSQRAGIGIFDAVRTAPFFLVAIVLTAVNLWFQTHGIDSVVRNVNFAQRLTGAGAVVWFYLAKAFAPIHLLFVYPQWQIDAHQWLWWLPLATALVVTLLLIRRHDSPTSNWRPALLLAWLFFCVALAPVLGFTDVGFMRFSLVADHYEHIALIAVTALVAAAWSVWYLRSEGLPRAVAIMVALGLVAALALMTRQQSELYHDAVTLYQATLDDNPSAWSIQNNLGLALQTQHKLAEATIHYRRALQLNPDYPDALNNLGIAMAEQGLLQDAIELYQQALRINPAHAKAHNSLGNALSDLGRYQEAIDQFQQALQLRPEYAIAHYNLGNALAHSGNIPDAIQQYQLAIQFDPKVTQAYLNMAAVYWQVHRGAEAIAAAQTALQSARSQGQSELVTAIEAWLNAHRDGEPQSP